MIINRILLFVMAVCAGSLLAKLHIPIPFLLGGMLTAVFSKNIGGRLRVSWPEKWRGYGLMVCGYGIGATFTISTWNNFLSEADGVLEANAVAIGLSMALAWLTARFTSVNLLSCVMGMMPGGLMQMLLLAEEDKRTNLNAVVVMQCIRLFGVIISVPFLVTYGLGAQVLAPGAAGTAQEGIHWLIFVPLAILGGWLAKKCHLPSSKFIGAILMTAVFSVMVGDLQPVPKILMSAAQVSVGLYMGMLLDADKLVKAKEVLPFVLGGTALLVTASIGVAFVLAERYGFSLVTAFLAMAPGGIAEMSLAGLSMGEDVSVILTYQLVRVLAINLLVPPALHWYFNEKAK